MKFVRFIIITIVLFLIIEIPYYTCIIIGKYILPLSPEYFNLEKYKWIILIATWLMGFCIIIIPLAFLFIIGFIFWYSYKYIMGEF